MKINVKFFAVDIPPELNHFSCELPEGAVVEDALDECLKLPQIKIEEDYFKSSTVHLNGKCLKLHSLLHDGDTITILRTLEGG